MDPREIGLELTHAVEVANSAVQEAWAKLADAYATLQKAEAQLRAYRRLLSGGAALHAASMIAAGSHANESE